MRTRCALDILPALACVLLLPQGAHCEPQVEASSLFLSREHVVCAMQASRHAAEGLVGVAARDRDAVLVEASSLLLVHKGVSI